MGDRQKFKKPLIFMMLSSVTILGSYSLLNKNVILNIDGQTVKLNTLSRSVESFLINEKINIEEGCRIVPPIDTKLKDKMEVKVINPYEVKVSDGNNDLVYKTNHETVEEVLNEFNIELNSKDIINKKLTDKLSKNDTIVITRVDEEIKKEVVEVPFEVQYIEDKTIIEGYTKKDTYGKNGKMEIKYKILYKNGVPIKKEKISEDMIIEPIKEVIRKGKLKVNSI
ncbi:MAG: G5 domain-containing protein [Peptostreptococcaceae bacterium]